MDFGTIYNNIEKGLKYKNSEDVLKDVEDIWKSCRQYYNKGDHIMDLMELVKKNLIKYWTAAGLNNKIEKPYGMYFIRYPIPSYAIRNHAPFMLMHMCINKMKVNGNLYPIRE